MSVVNAKTDVLSFGWFNNGATLTVNLANIRMNLFEHQTNSAKEIINKIPKKDLEACPKCNCKINIRGTGVKCEKFESCLHVKCQNIDDQIDEKLEIVIR